MRRAGCDGVSGGVCGSLDWRSRRVGSRVAKPLGERSEAAMETADDAGRFGRYPALSLAYDGRRLAVLGSGGRGQVDRVLVVEVSSPVWRRVKHNPGFRAKLGRLL